MTDIYNEFTAFDDDQPAPPPVPLPVLPPEETDEPDEVLAAIRTYTRAITDTDWEALAHWVTGGSIPSPAILTYLRGIGYPETTGVEASITSGAVTISTTGEDEVSGPEWAAFDGSSAVITTTVPWASTVASGTFSEPRVEHVVGFWEYLEGNGVSPATMLRRWDAAAEAYSIVVMADKAVDPLVSGAFAFAPPSAEVFARFVVRSLTLNPGPEEGFVVKRKTGDTVLESETGVDYSNIKIQEDSDGVRPTTPQIPVALLTERPLPFRFGPRLFTYEADPALGSTAPDVLYLGVTIHNGDIWQSAANTWKQWTSGAWVNTFSGVGANSGQVAIGYGATAEEGGTTAVGQDAQALGRYSTALGLLSRAEGIAISLGFRSLASATSSIAVGTSAQATGETSIAIGRWADAEALDSVAIGHSARPIGEKSVAIGYWAATSQLGTIAIGESSYAYGVQSVAIGDSAHAASTGSVALGHDARATPTDSIAIGNGAVVSSLSSRSFAIGAGAVVPVSRSDLGIFRANSTRTERSSGSGTTTHELYSADGTIGIIGVTNDDKITINGNVPATAGMPSAGTTGQVLAKSSATDYATQWKTLAKADVGLGNVDNTSDTNKPISTATQAALNEKYSFRIGALQSDRYLSLRNITNLGPLAGVALVANRLSMVPVWLDADRTVTNMRFEVTTAVSGNVTCAIYADAAGSGLPTGNPLAVTSATSVTTTGQKSISFTAPPDLVGQRWYWLALVSTTAMSIKGSTQTDYFPALRGGVTQLSWPSRT